VFDALTTKRPYKAAWSIEDSVAEIRRGAGSHFEPRLVAVFETLIPELLRIRAEWSDDRSSDRTGAVTRRTKTTEPRYSRFGMLAVS